MSEFGGFLTRKHCTQEENNNWVAPYYGCSLFRGKTARISRGLGLLWDYLVTLGHCVANVCRVGGGGGGGSLLLWRSPAAVSREMGDADTTRHHQHNCQISVKLNQRYYPSASFYLSSFLLFILSFFFNFVFWLFRFLILFIYYKLFYWLTYLVIHFFVCLCIFASTYVNCLLGYLRETHLCKIVIFGTFWTWFLIFNCVF